ncbi:MAG: hypothetical protein AAF961_08795 [Planctomycetota bacterium]
MFKGRPPLADLLPEGADDVITPPWYLLNAAEPRLAAPVIQLGSRPDGESSQNLPLSKRRIPNDD